MRFDNVHVKHYRGMKNMGLVRTEEAGQREQRNAGCNSAGITLSTLGSVCSTWLVSVVRSGQSQRTGLLYYLVVLIIRVMVRQCVLYGSHS